MGIIVEILSLNPLACQVSCFIGGALAAKWRMFLIGEMESLIEIDGIHPSYFFLMYPLLWLLFQICDSLAQTIKY